MSRTTFRFDNGDTFSEPEDWFTFARDALNETAVYPFFGLDLRHDYGGPDRRLGDLYRALRGTGAEHKLADGVMRVMETGSPRERFTARLGPYAEAPRVVERIEQLVTNDRAAIVGAGLLEVLISRLFRTEGASDAARRVLRRELGAADSPDLGSVATERDFDWFIAHLPQYRPTFDPRFWLRFLDAERTARLLDAMVSVAGYAERLRHDCTDTSLDAEQRSVLREQLLSHPIARQWVE